MQNNIDDIVADITRMVKTLQRDIRTEEITTRLSQAIRSSNGGVRAALIGFRTAIKMLNNQLDALERAIKSLKVLNTRMKRSKQVDSTEN